MSPIDTLWRTWNALRYPRLPRDDQPVVLLPPFKAAYLPIPKVACSSLESVCADLLGADLPADEWKAELFRKPELQRVAADRGWYATVGDLPVLTDYWKFAFVRNPWDRLVSCYCEKIRPGNDQNFLNGVSRILLPYRCFHANMTFGEFADAVIRIPDRVAEPHFRSQAAFLVGPQRQMQVDFVGRFESLREDFRQIAKRFSVEVDLPHLLPSDRGPYRDYYTPSLKNRVADRYRADIDRFGYTY